MNTVLAKKINIEHPKNKTGEGRRWLFVSSNAIYPDFILKTTPPIIADAKYKCMGNFLATKMEMAKSVIKKMIILIIIN